MALTKVPSNLDSVTATTQSQGDNSTNVATTAYVDTGLSNLIDSAPDNLNTLNELAAAMNDNASFFDTVLPLSGGTLTGDTAIIKSGNPSFTVKTTGAGNNPFIRIQADTNYWDIQSIFSNADDELDFRYNGNSKLIIDKDGNVGIGTITPNEKLEVAGNLTLTPSSPNNSPSANAAISDINFVGRTDNTVVAKIGAIHNDNTNGTDGQILFYTADNTASAAASEKMRIGSTGNVGISNTAPEALLQVGGDGITVNTYIDRSRTAIFRTTGSGNYSSSANNSASHAATFMRGTNAVTGDQVGHSYVFDDGNWSATAEIMAEVENGSNAHTRLNFKTWNGSMLTRQVITSDGQVIKPYQSAFVAVRNSTQSIAANQNVIFNQTYKNVGSDFNTVNGVYTAPFSGFYFFSYTLLLQSVSTNFHVDHYLKTSNHSFIGGMPGRIEYQAGISWGDGYLGMGHAQIAYMDAGDIAYVNFSELGGATRSLYGNTSNNWTKFTGYFLG